MSGPGEMGSGTSGLGTLLAEPRLQRLLAALDGAGEEVRIVGGAVRNALIGAPVEDVDLATTALPDEVMRRARAAGFRPAPTGYDHGTVTIVVERKPFEVTTLRADVETFGRHAKVEFGRDFRADAQRRDFTINSLSLSPDGQLHDPLGAQGDLAARRVRFIGDARARITEDYLRALRFFRFHAAYGVGALDAEGLAAVIARREGLRLLSSERIRAELLKLLAAQGAADAVRAMAEAGLFGILLGALAYPARLARLLAQDPQADVVLRLAALAVEVREDAHRLRVRLRLSNLEHRRLLAGAEALEHFHGGPPPQGVRLGACVLARGAGAVGDGLRLMAAQARDADAWRATLVPLEHYAQLKLPASGEDFKKRGLTEGHAIGAALKSLQALWIRAGFPREPSEIARLIDEAAQEAAQRMSEGGRT